MKLYEDLNGLYFLFDFNASHGELLLRKHKSGGTFNTDIRFKGVHSLNVINRFRGLTIFAVTQVESILCDIGEASKFVFKLIDNKSQLECFINASAFGVYQNTLDSEVSSLGEFAWSDENECLYWSGEDEQLSRAFN
ncbi:hypothetical protein EXU85_30750 [Spirosoma sp. KCTC 42546]|uniref:hypothetical protein n=1 Tax=Spirosoma sp. KCTC 42546 TaxID=2520506 RepID=UPI001156E4C0|nr:hypothetical protein [Spirosoma sp. KCTC 42546]QDK82752.1 hypothetical protein EXU85_30750 [Spirosoma sp. KCTC 42546]